MDFVSLLLSALLFAAFVPGVLGQFPKGGSRLTVLAVHGLAFAIVTSIIMQAYFNARERMGNYGDRCPNGFVPGVAQNGKPDCVPIGMRTYNPSTGGNVTSA
jgi:hypothetical protein